MASHIEPWAIEDRGAFRLKLPEGWRYVGDWGKAKRIESVDGLHVIFGLELHDDNREWIHVSVSRQRRMPSYDDLKLAKNALIGPDRMAVQLFVRKAEHVNLHNFCLHLWAPRYGVIEGLERIPE